jgi:D-alanine--poly(phosphoribitol) ligase subunit 1
MIDLVAAIEQWSQRTPSRTAHVWRGHQLSYRELAVRSDALACQLRARVSPGSPVIVYGHKEPGMLVSFLACIKAGHPYVPVDSGIPAVRIAKIVEHSRAGLVLAPGAAPPGITDIPQLAGGEFRAAAEGAPIAPPGRTANGPDDVVYIMYTSGSTGEPKGVQITFANLVSFLAWTHEVHPVGDGRRFLNQAPFSFDLSVMDLYMSLTTGGTLHSVDRSMVGNPPELREALVAANVEVWVSTPSFAELCLADRRFTAANLPAITWFLFCGETLTPACVRRLRERFPDARVYNLYGPTEATVAVTSVLVEDALLDRFPTLPLGTPRPDTRLVVIDGEGREVAPGKSGEIVIDGPCVGLGYLHAPELTARVFTGQRYRTGDAGHYEGDALIFEGRLDLQVKLFGHRIELEDVAANLVALAGVEHAVVLPVERGGRVDGLAAFVVAADGLTPAAIREALGRRVPGYMVPRDILCRPQLPMTVNGKLDRALLATELARMTSG